MITLTSTIGPNESKLSQSSAILTFCAYIFILHRVFQFVGIYFFFRVAKIVDACILILIVGNSILILV